MKYQNQSKCILLVYIQFLVDQIWRRAELNCSGIYAPPIMILVPSEATITEFYT